MNISTDKFIISIRHTNNSTLAVEIIDSVTGMLTYNTVPVKELDLDALEQELVEKIRARNTLIYKAQNQDDYGELYKLTKPVHNVWADPSYQTTPPGH